MGVLDWPSSGADHTTPNWTTNWTLDIPKLTTLLLLITVSIHHSKALFLIDPSTGRAVAQEGSSPRRAYWQWGSTFLPRLSVQSQLSVMQDLVEATDTEDGEESVQTVESQYVKSQTPFVHAQQAEPRNDYVSVHGTPLYKLRKRNPYGRK